LTHISDAETGKVSRADRTSPLVALEIEGYGKISFNDNVVVNKVEVRLVHDHSAPIAFIDIVQPDAEWVNDPALEEWRKVEIRMGYPATGLEQVGGAFYTHKPKFSVNNQGQVMMSLVCFGEQFKLAATEKRRMWGTPKDGIKAETIVRDIAAMYDLDTEIENTGMPLPMQPQVNRTDWAFLDYLAERFGYALFVEGGGIGKKAVLHFHKPRMIPSQFTFVLLSGNQSNVADFSVSSDVFMRGVQFKTDQIDYANPREPVNAVALMDKDDNITTLLKSASKGIIQSSAEATRIGEGADVPVQYEVETTVSGNELSHIVPWLQGRADASKWFMEASGMTFGLEKLAPRQVVLVVNAGRHGGYYYVTSVTHRYMRGEYVTEFELSRTYREKAGDSLLAGRRPLGTLISEGVATVLRLVGALT